MSTFSNILGSNGNSLLPDLNINVKAFDQLSIVKRIYDQIKTRSQDLLNKGIHNYTIQAPNVPPAYTNTITAGAKEFDEFKSLISIRNGFAKPNWFKVYITQPKTESDMAKEVSFFCESATIPSHNIMTTTIRNYGVPGEYAYAKAYQNVGMTFLVDTNMGVKNFFDSWIHLIVDDTENGTEDVGFLDDYSVTIDIYQLAHDTAGVVYWTKLLNAFPKMVSELPVSHAASPSFHKLHVEFTYHKMITYQYNIGREDSIQKPLPTEIMQSFIRKEIIPFSTNGFTANNPFGQLMNKASEITSNIRSKVLSSFNFL